MCDFEWGKTRVQGIITLGSPWRPLANTLMNRGIKLLGYDPDVRERQDMSRFGIHATSSVQAVVLHLPVPQAVWLAVADEAGMLRLSRQLAGLLEAGSTVLDASNSDWLHEQQIAGILGQAGVRYLPPRSARSMLEPAF